MKYEPVALSLSKDFDKFGLNGNLNATQPAP